MLSSIGSSAVNLHSHSVHAITGIRLCPRAQACLLSKGYGSVVTMNGICILTGWIGINMDGWIGWWIYLKLDLEGGGKEIINEYWVFSTKEIINGC